MIIIIISHLSVIHVVSQSDINSVASSIHFSQGEECKIKCSEGKPYFTNCRQYLRNNPEARSKMIKKCRQKINIKRCKFLGCNNDGNAEFDDNYSCEDFPRYVAQYQRRCEELSHDPCKMRCKRGVARFDGACSNGFKRRKRKKCARKYRSRRGRGGWCVDISLITWT